jgi:hypothetical protein
MAEKIVEKLISEQNQYDLFYNILLSVKSKNPGVKIEEDLSKSKWVLETDYISIRNSDDNKTDTSSFNIKISKEEVFHIFSRNTYNYNISIYGAHRPKSYTRVYSTSFQSIHFKSEKLSYRCMKIIGEIFNYLVNIEEQRKIEQTNNSIKDIISDISTTVDKSYRRDNKIDEVLNK